MMLHYWVREYSEGIEFPEVHIYQDQATARRVMIDEAFEAATNWPDARVTEQMDGPTVAYSEVSPGIRGLNVQWSNDGAVDCFRLGEQDL